MTTWRIYFWSYALTVAMLTAAFTFGILGIWFQSARCGGTAALLGVPAVLYLIFGSIAWMYNIPDRPERSARLPRSERQRIREAEARVRADRIIRDLEREAGIHS